MTVPFLDLRVRDPEEKAALLAATERVLDHGRLVMGPEVEELETAVAARCGRKYAVGVSSGTGALFMAVRALGLDKGDDVITTSMSWIATANGIAVNGPAPVFADIRDDLNIDPASVERLITPKTKAILPVHFSGRVSPMEPLLEIAKRHGIPVIEDAAQAFGAKRRGRQAGNFGLMGCFSMNAMKMLAGCGDGGMVVTDDPDLRDKLVSLRYNGTINKEDCHTPSLNGRLDTLQAALLLERLKRVDRRIERRRAVGFFYNEALAGVGDLILPTEGPDDFHSYYAYTLRTPRRDALMAHLTAAGIESKVYHPILMPRHTAYRESARGEWSHADRCVAEILCLPCNETLSQEDVERVAAAVTGFFR